MAAPAIRRFVVGDRVYVRAQQAWLILVAHVMSSEGQPFAKRLLTYGVLASRMGDDPRAAIGLSRELGIVGQYCIQNHVPALNCIVVNQMTGAPGDHVVLPRANRRWQDEAKEVLRTDWFRYRVPTTGTFRQVWEEMNERR